MKAFKFRCFPNEAQQQMLQKTFGSCRFVWNKLVAENSTRDKISITELSNQFFKLKTNQEFYWLAEPPAVALQQTLVILANAFYQLRKAPKFKSKTRDKNSFRVVGNYAIRIKNREVFLPKDKEKLEIKWSRDLPCKPTSYTVSQSKNGKYWISFLCKEFEPKLTNGQGVLGIDLGLKDLVVDSDGNKYDNPKFFCRAQKALAKAQRVLARRKKGSKRREKARLRVARKYAKVANQRKDYLHKLTRKLVNENQVIGIEDLNVRGMSKNRRLAKSIMDSGLGMFKRFLEYKASESAHTVIVKMNRWEPSTQTCNACGERVSKNLLLSTRAWTCEFCGAVHDRDINASLNIKYVAKYMVDKNKPLGGTLVLAPPMLHILRNIPRTAVNAQLISIQKYRVPENIT